jgi:Protein of unknown function (DUF4230)
MTASRVSLTMLVGSSLAAFGVGYVVAPKERLDTEVENKGFFSTMTSTVLSATVDSLRNENKLLVFSYKGTVKVRAEIDGLLFFNGEQNLIVPAGVNYYLDLSQLTLADVVLDEKAKLVRVKLPKLQIGDIAFQPENSMTENGGLLTFNAGQIEKLNRVNYKAARRAMVKQAQGKTLVANAKRQAQTNVATYFEIPLRIAGHPDVKVVTTFE